MKIHVWLAVVCCASFIFSSCASAPTIQPQINGLVIAGRFKPALKILEENKEQYGINNRLLYLLDYGLLLHLAGRYEESIPIFEEAKQIYDQLYTASLSKEAAAWLINDYFAPYRGEDFERLMINVFQALNYAALDNIEEALVEARDVDVKLGVINAQYKPDQKNVYKEDAFVRLLMGILYEASGTLEDLDNARISYQKALETYRNDFEPNYDLPAPSILQENIDELDQQKSQGQIYLIHYAGISPIKHQVSLPLPTPDGHLVALAFPFYDKRQYQESISDFKIVTSGDAQESQVTTELAEDIGAIATKNLDNRKARVIAKSVLRAGLKYWAEKNIENRIDKNHGEGSSDWFRYIGSLYNIASEQADLRSWQTLPDQIRLAKLSLDPGEYTVSCGAWAKHVSVSAGQTKFLIVRTANY